MPTTELVVLTLKPGSNIGDPSNEAAVVLKQTADTLHNTPGCQAIHFGTVVEDESKLRLIIDWDSYDKHKQFMDSSGYQPFLGRIKSIIAGPPQINHVDFSPAGALHEVLSAPVTEIATFNFDGDVPADYGAGVEKLAAMADQIPKAKGIAWGSTHETIDKDGVQGKAAVVMIGWDTVDDHMAFRETSLFKDVIPYLRSSSKGASMQHIPAMKYIADS